MSTHIVATQPLAQPPTNPRPWDYYIPIVATGTTTKIYFTDDFVSPDNYNEACHIIESAASHETIQLIINTGGGNPDSALMVIDSIKRSKCKNIIGRAVGTVASAGTMVALSCPKLDVADNLSFMIHNYSATHSGDAHKLKSLQEFFDNEYTDYFRTLYEGFLTEEELDKVFSDGKDFWLNSNEVRRRLVERTKYFKELRAGVKHD